MDSSDTKSLDVHLIFESRSSPGKKGEFLLTYDSERHCESQVRCLNSYKGVSTKTEERVISGRTVWQVTIDGLGVPSIESETRNDGTVQYSLIFPTQIAAGKLKRCLGLPDTYVVHKADVGGWSVEVRSTFTEAFMDSHAFNSVREAQSSGRTANTGHAVQALVPSPEAIPLILEENGEATPKAPIRKTYFSLKAFHKKEGKKRGVIRALMERLKL